MNVTTEKEARRKLWQEMVGQSFDPREWYERDEDTVQGDGHMWVYRKTGNCWTVGFYGPDRQWNADGSYDTAKEAADRVNYLNGGKLERGESAVADAARRGYADR